MGYWIISVFGEEIISNNHRLLVCFWLITVHPIFHITSLDMLYIEFSIAYMTVFLDAVQLLWRRVQPYHHQKRAGK